MTAQPLHPLVELMRRYCYAYTASHDFRVCGEIMVPGYRLCMGPHRIAGRDDGYRPAVQRQFDQFPGLGFVVHELITTGDRLAMRFSEHGRSRYRGTTAVWEGISTYRWDGQRLTECWVEQDYYARRRQLTEGTPNPIAAPGMDPWSVVPVGPDPDAEAAVAAWLRDGDLAAAPQATLDDHWCASPEHVALEGVTTTIDDIFGAGQNVAFHVTRRGRYHGGLHTVPPDDACGRTVTSYASGLARVSDGKVAQVRVITDRLGTLKSLTKAA